MNSIPVITLFEETKASKRGTREWDTLCKRVREAGENWGCFEVVYHEFPPKLRAEAFSALKPLFHLPHESKARNTNPKPYHSYSKKGSYEGFGIEDASNMESVQRFAALMWSQDAGSHPAFCQTITTLVKHVEKLMSILETMLMDSYGLGDDHKLSECRSQLRVMRYTPSTGEGSIQLAPHTDKCLLTILCEEQVSGLEVFSKLQGKWVPVSPSPNSLIFVVGDPLMAWSNGKLHAVKHRVVLKEEKERLAWGAFAFPKEGARIKAPDELVDEEHPLAFKEFDYTTFLNFALSTETQIDPALQLHVHAGVTTKPTIN